MPAAFSSFDLLKNPLICEELVDRINPRKQLIRRRISWTGFWVGWSNLSSSDPPMMNFGDGDDQPVEFSPALPNHGAFFFRTYQHGSCWNQ